MSAIQQYDIDDNGALRHRPCGDPVVEDVDQLNLEEILSAAVEHTCSPADEAPLPFRTETVHLHAEGVTAETCEKCKPDEPVPDPDVDGVRLACVDSRTWDLEARPAALAPPTWELIFGAMVTARALGSIGCSTSEQETGLHYTARRRTMPQGARSPYLWDIFLTSAPADVTAPESHCGHDACRQRRTCVYDPLR